MSVTEEAVHTAAAEQVLHYDGGVAVGPASDNHVPVEHDICVVYCLEPRRKRRHLGCPSCYNRVAVRALTGDEIPPAGTRFAWLVGSFLGGWAAAWRDATVGMVRKTASE